jgi:hypothetical protein
MLEEKQISTIKIDWARATVMIVGLVLLTAVVIVAILRDRVVNQQFKNVTITGQGRVTYVPDIAIITLGVQIDKAAKPEEALNQLNVKIAAITRALQLAGVTADSIQAQNYYLYPQYDYKDNVSTVSGYNANEQLVVKIKSYDQNPNLLSQAIATASQAGANQVNNLAFDASNMNDLKQQARIKAIADAKAKSSALAGAAGVELKDITSWYENLVSPSINPSLDAGKGGQGGGPTTNAQIPDNDHEVVMEVSLTYNIK